MGHDLRGEWIGNYPGHYDEVIVIEQEGDEVVARKVTGDDHVPAGEITWRANVATLSGQGQVAEEGFVRPCFVEGRLKILSPERIQFSWAGVGTVEYRKD